MKRGGVSVNKSLFVSKVFRWMQENKQDKLCPQIFENKQIWKYAEAFTIKFSKINKEYDIKPFLEEIAQFFQKQPVLWITQIDLKFHNLRDADVQILAEALRGCPLLVTLDLSKNRFGDDGAIALCDSLRFCESLKWIDLCDNAIQDQGGLAIAEFIKTNVTLKTFFLWDNDIGKVGLEAISQALSINHFILDIFLVGNDLDDKIHNTILEKVRQNKQFLYQKVVKRPLLYLLCHHEHLLFFQQKNAKENNKDKKKMEIRQDAAKQIWNRMHSFSKTKKVLNYF